MPRVSECLPDDSSLGRAEKVQELPDLLVAGGVQLIEGFDLSSEIESFFKKERLIGGFECPDIFRSKAAALQSDQVEATNLGGVSICDGERGNILDDFGATSDHGVGTDPAELMDTGHPGENDVVFNSHVTCQSGGIGENAVISHNRIVCNMGVG